MFIKRIARASICIYLFCFKHSFSGNTLEIDPTSKEWRMVPGLTADVERLDDLWSGVCAGGALQQGLYLVTLRFPPSDSSRVSCGTGGQLWSQDNHLIITIAVRRAVVISDRRNKEAYVNTSNECPVLPVYFLWFMENNNMHNHSCIVSPFLIIWQRRSKIMFRKWGRGKTQQHSLFCVVFSDSVSYSGVF